ncbi:MAG: hypothetical protein CL912_29990 [Deltaproteobacteria bacterium]|nr:hypothetical protein [Deltaproteobacteria bacterium]
MLEKGSKTLPERCIPVFVERYLDSAAREVPLECILGGEDVLSRRRRFEDFSDNGLYTITKVALFKVWVIIFVILT